MVQSQPLPKVLVVDDMQDTARTVAWALEARGFTTAFCFNGRQALALAREFRPDAMLLNYMMPDLSGLGVLDILKARPETARIRVLMTSGYATSQVAARFRDAGADGFIPLPFTAALAAAAIQHVLGPGPEEFVVAGSGVLTPALGAR